MTIVVALIVTTVTIVVTMVTIVTKITKRMSIKQHIKIKQGSKVKQGLVLFIVWLSGALGLAYAQNIPDLGNVSETLWSKHEEISIGQTAYHQMQRRGMIHQAPADVDYLNYLGQKIGSLAQTRVGLHFYLTQSLSVNAFAMPGGYVGVNAGLVLLTDNEHELAGVLAHEIAHISQNHIARSVLAAKDRQWANAAAAAASILLATTSDSSDLGASGVSAVIANETQQQLNIIRQHEKEADRVGRDLIEKSGFNPLGMQLFFAKLFTPEYAANTPAFLLTHPMPVDRQADIDDLRQKNQQLSSSDEYYLFRARLQADYLAQETIDSTVTQALASASPQVRSAGHYLSALQAVKQGQINQAQRTIEKMSSRMQKNRDVQLLMAKLHLLQNETNAAMRLYERLWGKFIGDSVVGYDFAHFLNERGQHQRAAEILSQLIDANPLNAQLYWLYGEVLGRLNQVGMQKKVVIRYYETVGNFEQALIQVNIALQQTTLDWQDRAALEAKAKTLKQQIEQSER
ncbi:M48 family metalloprotease [Ostreibacterium oceani]|nr:M48 family metalloprotease [Ostreibacterium oceani]